MLISKSASGYNVDMYDQHERELIYLRESFGSWQEVLERLVEQPGMSVQEYSLKITYALALWKLEELQGKSTHHRESFTIKKSRGIWG